MSSAIVLLAHGSRDPLWSRPILAIADRVRTQRPDLAVGVAFLEFATPGFADCVRVMVECGASQVHIAPVFLGQGAHLRRDVDTLLATARTAWPDVAFTIGGPMGEAPAVLDAIAGWAVGTPT